KLVGILKADHDATREFVSKPIGKSADNMYSYLALVQDDPTVQPPSCNQNDLGAYLPELRNPRAEMTGGFSFSHLFSIRFRYGQN
ncbi:hypothetical protein MJL33_33415, partial [Salmonella enterica subsp. enterica serovar Kentucky]|nr:hypothetical protein [Salmonella enterica subsp. enterica serovar Kentucky]